MHKIIFTKNAEYDVQNIREFIWNIRYANLVIETLYSFVDLLEKFPEMWIEISEDEREIVEPKYKYQIRYAIIWQEIYILLIYKFNNIKWR